MSWKFKDWYSKNKEALAEKRKARYRDDPEYKSRVLSSSANRRKANKPAQKEGMSVTELCEALGVKVWTLNRWKNQGYIPVPTLRGYRFSAYQLQLLGLYRQFFLDYPNRAASLHPEKLQSIIEVVHHNWGA